MGRELTHRSAWSRYTRTPVTPGRPSNVSGRNGARHTFPLPAVPAMGTAHTKSPPHSPSVLQRQKPATQLLPTQSAGSSHRKPAKMGSTRRSSEDGTPSAPRLAMNAFSKQVLATPQFSL